MSSVCQRFPSIKELHDIPDVPPPEQGLTDIEEQVQSEEETIPIQEELVPGMTLPLPGKIFFKNIINLPYVIVKMYFVNLSIKHIVCCQHQNQNPENLNLLKTDKKFIPF